MSGNINCLFRFMARCKYSEMDWLTVMARITYQQACAQNWPRPTCVSCHTPCAYDREFRGAHLCQSCYREEIVYTMKKELLHGKPE